jgi:putative redox protein
MTSTLIYTGNLHCELKHVASGTIIQTDAPVDNHGKGEAFSPTDLTATSLAACMLTTMGIASQTHRINMDDASATCKKVMFSEPRRIGEIHIVINMPKNNFSQKEKTILENAARTCPVMQSLHPDIKKELQFVW